MRRIVMPTLDGKIIENELYDNGIYEAWQFVKNTNKTFDIAEYCKNTISDLISTMEKRA